MSLSSSIDEFMLIDRLLSGVPIKAEGLLHGVGDDCAVLAGDGRRDWLISTDNVLENIHFKTDWMPLAQIGRKAALAALSDISAMGGQPRFLLIGIGIPQQMSSALVQECFSGIRAVAAEVGALVIGGDTSNADQCLTLNITAIGDVEHGRAIYRRGARQGDKVFVTGTLGASAAGLTMLQRGGHPSDHAFIRRHCEPPMRADVAKWLASTGCVTSMIDISDGLMADLDHIAVASGVGMCVEGLRVPQADGLTTHEEIVGPEPLLTAVTSGEEYELLFTVTGPRVAVFQQMAAAVARTHGHPISHIGRVVEGDTVQLVNASGSAIDVPEPGFVHRFA